MSKQYPFAYIRKKMCKTADAVVPIQCKAIQYGLGIFSGIRGNWNAKHKNLYLFRMRDHYDRLKEAASIMQMNFPHTYKQFEKIVFDLIKKNKAKEDVYLRPTIYAASTALTPRLNNPDDDLAIYMISLKDYFSTDKGLSVCISSYRRMDDDVISIKAKSTGGYTNSALAKSEALQNGYDEAIFLNRDGKVCEATGANIFGIKDGVVFTPPLGGNILNGITRRSIIELMECELDMEVREEAIDRSMLYTFDELFFTGTAAKVSWIAAVDKRKIGNGKQGKITTALQEMMEEISKGEVPEYNDWLVAVY